MTEPEHPDEMTKRDWVGLVAGIAGIAFVVLAVLYALW